MNWLFDLDAPIGGRCVYCEKIHDGVCFLMLLSARDVLEGNDDGLEKMWDETARG